MGLISKTTNKMVDRLYVAIIIILLFYLNVILITTDMSVELERKKNQ